MEEDDALGGIVCEFEFLERASAFCVVIVLCVLEVLKDDVVEVVVEEGDISACVVLVIFLFLSSSTAFVSLLSTCDVVVVVVAFSCNSGDSSFLTKADVIFVAM